MGRLVSGFRIFGFLSRSVVFRLLAGLDEASHPRPVTNKKARLTRAISLALVSGFGRFVGELIHWINSFSCSPFRLWSAGRGATIASEDEVFAPAITGLYCA
jgi:hypothetical protein